MIKIISVVGARPNFMKMAPIHKELQKHKKSVTHKIVHTGQHYDKKMSDVFFKELQLPKPHIYLGIGSGSHAEQTAKVMMAFEKIVIAEKPDLVLVYGDVNSTLAASVVASKLLLKNSKPVSVAHIESGLRSGDLSMPEEINRMVTDVLANYLFVTEPDGEKNLLKSGITKRRIFYCGNTMIDSLNFYLQKSTRSKILSELCVEKDGYVLVTLHRPSNVDDKNNLKTIFSIFKDVNKVSPERDIIFPVHPRTLKRIDEFKLNDELESIRNLIITEPLGYLDFVKLMSDAKYVMTDSGGIQEETTALQIPCLTLRENTERPVTSQSGSNTICGLNTKLIHKKLLEIESGKYKKGRVPKYWDGKAAQRIVSKILTLLK